MPDPRHGFRAALQPESVQVDFRNCGRECATARYQQLLVRGAKGLPMSIDVCCVNDGTRQHVSLPLFRLPFLPSSSA